MCGIAGFFDPRQERPDEALASMAGALHSRGPDEKGWYSDAGFGIAIARLKIIDLSTGSQPIFNEDKSLVVVLNGEIYNFQELREELTAKGHVFSSRSDTEVLVHLYEEEGQEMCRRLNGMFSFAIYSRKDRSLFIARDRMGKKPLYFVSQGGRFAFASEPKALFRLGWVGRSLSPEALVQYLMLEYVPWPLSIYEGVRKLPPAGRMMVRPDGTDVSEYWSPTDERRRDLPVREACVRLRELLDDAVRVRLVSDVPIGVFLSGGIDSSVVTAFASRHKPDLMTFSVGFEEKSFDESEWIHKVSRRFGTRHHHQVFNGAQMIDILPSVFGYLDEPFADASVLPTTMLSRFAREKVTVALAGDGGDEIFAGYPTYQAHKLAAYFDRLPRWAVRSFAGLVERLPVSLDNFSLDFKLKKFCSGLGLPDHRRNTVWLGSFAPEGIRDLLVPGLVSGTDDPFRLVDSRLEGTSLSGTLSRILRFDMKTYLTDDILVKADRASMSCSLEARSPFLDHRVVEFASSLPVDYLLHGWTTKWILKTSMKGILPDDVIRRKKKGFGIPVGYWLKNQLRGLAGDLLSPDRIRRQGLFDPDRITRLFEEHLQGVRDNRKPLWTLMAFQLWYDSWGSASGR